MSDRLKYKEKEDIIMENIEKELLDRKLDKYGNNTKDFTAPGELTVTITLDEYRELVSSHATRSDAISKAESDRYERNEKIKELTTEVEKLKAELYETKKMLDACRETEEAKDEQVQI